MSQQVYHYNATKDEYVWVGDYQGGNGGYRDILRNEFPRFMMWLMSTDWRNDRIQCIDEADLRSIPEKMWNENVTFKQQSKYYATKIYTDWKKEQKLQNKLAVLGEDFYKVMEEKHEHPLVTKIKPFQYQCTVDEICEKTGLMKIEVETVLKWMSKSKQKLKYHI